MEQFDEEILDDALLAVAALGDQLVGRRDEWRDGGGGRPRDAGGETDEAAASVGRVGVACDVPVALEASHDGVDPTGGVAARVPQLCGDQLAVQGEMRERQHLGFVERQAPPDREAMACRGELAPVQEFTDPRGGRVGCGVRAVRVLGRRALTTFGA
jgi:hypothetical protein